MRYYNSLSGLSTASLLAILRGANLKSFTLTAMDQENMLLSIYMKGDQSRIIVDCLPKGFDLEKNCNEHSNS